MRAFARRRLRPADGGEGESDDLRRRPRARYRVAACEGTRRLRCGPSRGEAAARRSLAGSKPLRPARSRADGRHRAERELQPSARGRLLSARAEARIISRALRRDPVSARPLLTSSNPPPETHLPKCTLRNAPPKRTPETHPRNAPPKRTASRPTMGRLAVRSVGSGYFSPLTAESFSTSPSKAAAISRRSAA